MFDSVYCVEHVNFIKKILLLQLELTFFNSLQTDSDMTLRKLNLNLSTYAHHIEE